MRKTEQRRSSFLRSLRKSESGNAIVIVAASLVPLLGAIGGGVDLTRAYMAEARLSQACDAAVLAGRKAMQNDDASEGSDARNEIEKFIAYNFPDGTFGAAPIAMAEPTVSEEGELTLKLASNIPAEILPIVGIERLAINAECTSRRSGVNVDVVLVVDVTGSMASAMGATTRIAELRAATGTFLDILNDLETQLSPNGMRVRVGIVPYSQAVNVGKLLYADNPAYIDYAGEPYSTDLGVPRMESRLQNGRMQYRWTNDVISGTSVSLDLDDFVQRGLSEATPSNPYAWKGCVESRATVQTIDSTDAPYTSIPDNAWDILDVAPGESTSAGTAPAWRPYFATPNSGFAYEPNTSYLTMTEAPWSQLRWNMGGNWRTDDTTKYYDGSLLSPSYYPGGGGPNAYCPDEARTLTELSDTAVSSLKNYVNALTPNGGTYHDLGMYWGLAVISPSAPFSNPDTYLAPGFTGDARDVRRYIVFMTDGDLSPNHNIYYAHGYHDWDHRVGVGMYDQEDQHRARFRMICEAAKKQGVEVSTVVFSDSVTSTDQASLKACATSADQYYTATQTGDLEKAFTKIAQNIGYLRISN